MLRRPVAAFAISKCLLLAAPLALADGPLERLADRVPLGAPGMVALSDVAASVAEITPLAEGFSPADRRIMAYLPLTLVGGFEPYQAWKISAEGGLTDRLGYEIEEVGQIASWRRDGDAPVVIAGLAERAAKIGSALTVRGFARVERFGGVVWTRQEDGDDDVRRSEEDPFSQRAGYPGRFTFDQGYLLFARSWAGITRLANRPLGLRADADIAALLAAGYLAEERGRLIEVLVLGTQPRLLAAVERFHGTGPDSAAKTAASLKALEIRGPALPAFRRHALMLWQDGERISGAVAIAYATEAEAQAAVERFPDLLERTISLYAGGFLGGVLPYDPHFTVIEAEGRWVAILAFEGIGGKFSGRSPMMFVTNPFGRLREMRISGDLQVLLSGE